MEAPAYTSIRDRTLQTLQQNMSAYNIVAADAKLTFDLNVVSDPQGAEISYKKRGDSYKKHPKDTDATIENPAYAVWTIQVKKPGWQDSEEKEHDPYRETNHVVTFKLKPK